MVWVIHYYDGIKDIDDHHQIKPRSSCPRKAYYLKGLVGFGSYISLQLRVELMGIYLGTIRDSPEQEFEQNILLYLGNISKAQLFESRHQNSLLVFFLLFAATRCSVLQ